MEERDLIRQQISELAGVIARLSILQMKELMIETGLSHTQVMSLMRLNYHGGCGVSQLADHLGTTDAASSQMVQRLVTLNLVERTESHSDRREKKITLSAEGKKLVDRVIESRRKMIEDMIADLPADKQTAMIEAISLLVKSAHEYEDRQLEHGTLLGD